MTWSLAPSCWLDNAKCSNGFISIYLQIALDQSKNGVAGSYDVPGLIDFAVNSSDDLMPTRDGWDRGQTCLCGWCGGWWTWCTFLLNLQGPGNGVEPARVDMMLETSPSHSMRWLEMDMIKQWSTTKKPLGWSLLETRITTPPTWSGQQKDRTPQCWVGWSLNCF